MRFPLSLFLFLYMLCFIRLIKMKETPTNVLEKIVSARNRENLSAPSRKSLVKKGGATNWYNATFSSRNLIAKLVVEPSEVERNGRVIRRFSSERRSK